MKVVPIVLAVVAACLTVWRWPRLGWPLRAAGAASCIALALYGAGIVRLPEFETLLGTIGSTLGSFTYALVAVMAFLETGAFVGLLVPGETVVIVGGVVAGQGHIEVLPLLGLTWCCAFGGDLTGYLLGRRLGRRFLLAHGPRVHITEARLVRVEDWFARYGLGTILIGRFVGLVRPVAPFLAGASRYPPARFCGLALLGTGLWSAAFVLLGFLCWQSFDRALTIAKRGSLALAATVALMLGLVVAYRYLRTRSRRAHHPPGPRRRPSAAAPDWTTRIGIRRSRGKDARERLTTGPRPRTTSEDSG
jgi:undecaprenyl-diphosphatase